MKSLACVCALFVCGVANAQTYIDETSNFGSMTTLAGSSPFGYVDEFSLPDESPTYILGATTITIHGQNGPTACSGRGCRSGTAKTTFNPPQLMQAIASTDGSQWTDAAPATDSGGNPVAFACTSAIKSPCTVWQYTGDLPCGSYTLHVAGTSCGGYLCQLQGDSYVYVTSKPVYTYVPQPCVAGCSD